MVDKLPTSLNWCRISSINNITLTCFGVTYIYFSKSKTSTMTQSLKTNQLICFPIEKPSATAKLDMDVSKNRGKNPKWMVKIMENPIKMDDLGVFPYFWKHPKSCFCSFSFVLGRHRTSSLARLQTIFKERQHEGWHVIFQDLA